jgi:hypothetical protein
MASSPYREAGVAAAETHIRPRSNVEQLRCEATYDEGRI